MFQAQTVTSVVKVCLFAIHQQGSGLVCDLGVLLLLLLLPPRPGDYEPDPDRAPAAVLTQHYGML